MDLFIVRHAWAGHFGDPTWPDDSQRPLEAAGRRRFARLVAELSDRGLAPDLVASSPMKRCMETAELLAEGVSGHPEVVARDELLPGGSVAELVAWTARQAERHGKIAWVGHAPDVGHLAAALVGPGEAAIRFGKGAICMIRFPDLPQLGAGELRWLATAKLLGC
jgi:phosphohistidine phosphatase